VNKLTDKPMGSLKKYVPVLIIILPVIIAVVLRGTSQGHFRYDAERWAEPSVSGENIITPERLSQLKGDVILLNLGGDLHAPTVIENQMAIPADSVLTKGMMKKLSRNNGAIVLWSGDPAISARIWMILSQTGIRELYILNPDSLNESLKEKFRADTTISPEL